MDIIVSAFVLIFIVGIIGLFGAPVYPVDLKRMAGLVLLGGGAALVAIK